jgi:hypothetical protein
MPSNSSFFSLLMNLVVSSSFSKHMNPYPLDSQGVLCSATQRFFPLIFYLFIIGDRETLADLTGPKHENFSSRVLAFQVLGMHLRNTFYFMFITFFCAPIKSLSKGKARQCHTFVVSVLSVMSKYFTAKATFWKSFWSTFIRPLKRGEMRPFEAE